jgi:hypothetical protein
MKMGRRKKSALRRSVDCKNGGQILGQVVAGGAAKSVVRLLHLALAPKEAVHPKRIGSSNFFSTT